MLTVDEALRAVLGRRPRPCRPGASALAEALGLRLAEDVAADLDLPPFDKALVDGFAVRAGRPRRRRPAGSRVGEEITAGRTPTRPLGPARPPRS